MIKLCFLIKKTEISCKCRKKLFSKGRFQSFIILFLYLKSLNDSPSGCFCDFQTKKNFKVHLRHLILIGL